LQPTKQQRDSINRDQHVPSIKPFLQAIAEAWDSDDAADYLPAAPQREFLRPELDKTALMIRFRSNEGVKTQRGNFIGAQGRGCRRRVQQKLVSRMKQTNTAPPAGLTSLRQKSTRWSSGRSEP
jgi:hypothetical protein